MDLTGLLTEKVTLQWGIQPRPQVGREKGNRQKLVTSLDWKRNKRRPPSTVEIPSLITIPFL